MNRHWNLTVGDAFEFVRNGKSIKQDRDAGGLPITRIETIADGEIDIERVGYAGVELVGNEQWLLREGDILFSHINSVQHVGKCAIYEGTPAQLIHGMNLLALRPSKNLHPRYALYALRQPAFRAQLLQFVNKAVNQASVSATNLKSMPFSLPPLDEQRRIAAILDKADALRQTRKRAIALLDSLTQSIFLDMFGSHMDPKGTLGEVTSEFRYGTSQKSGPMGHPTLRIPNVARGSISLDDLKTVEVDKKEFERLRLRTGDLLFVRTNGNRDNVGRSAVIDESLSAKSGMTVSSFIFASYLIRSRLIEGTVRPAFVQAYLSTSRGRASLLERSKTSAGQFNINTEGLGSIPLPMPDIALQKEFESRIHKVQGRVNTWVDGDRHLETLFACLQHRAFSGQL